jgi:hypothetical protein
LTEFLIRSFGALNKIIEVMLSNNYCCLEKKEIVFQNTLWRRRFNPAHILKTNFFEGNESGRLIGYSSSQHGINLLEDTVFSGGIPKQNDIIDLL